MPMSWAPLGLIFCLIAWPRRAQPVAEPGDAPTQGVVRRRTAESAVFWRPSSHAMWRRLQIRKFFFTRRNGNKPPRSSVDRWRAPWRAPNPGILDL